MTRPQADPAQLRIEYKLAALDVPDVDADPFRQFARWFDEAVSAKVPEPNAMTLATVDAHGQPSARIVLLKDADAQGLTFYTNYQSRKGQELAANAGAALLFFWPELERQVRLEGTTTKVDAGIADAYFRVRPRLSQLGAWASPQSTRLPDRAALEARFADVQQRFPDGEVPRPGHWGGYRLTPRSFEFWQGRRSRLHDRIVYRHGTAGWQIERLAP